MTKDCWNVMVLWLEIPSSNLPLTYEKAKDKHYQFYTRLYFPLCSREYPPTIQEICFKCGVTTIKIRDY